MVISILLFLHRARVDTMPPEKLHWAHLYSEVVTTGLCTGCAGCVIACPHHVLRYNDSDGVYKPFKIEEAGGPTNCTHGQKGCTVCTRACPRFQHWEPEIDSYLFGRERLDSETAGISSEILFARATDPEILERGQDGGLVSALLIWAIEHELIDAALVSSLQGGQHPWKAVPHFVTNRKEVLEASGSRYTYSANMLAYNDAVEAGYERLALVGMGCQVSSPAVMAVRKAGKIARRISLRIGLLCSKTFDDAIFDELFEARYGLHREEMVKMNIKGRIQIWMRNGDYHEVPLKEARDWTRDGCKACPDFSAEHADISTGGIGTVPKWTLTLVRTDQGKQIIDAMVSDGSIEVRPGSDDPETLLLLDKLSRASRRRWPATADEAPRRVSSSH